MAKFKLTVPYYDAARGNLGPGDIIEYAGSTPSRTWIPLDDAGNPLKNTPTLAGGEAQFRVDREK